MTQKVDPVIREVLQQNTQVAEEIQSAARELEVVHAVLAATVPDQAAVPDVQAAVDRIEVIEQKLDEAVGSLDDSNERLREIASPPQ